MNAIVYKITNIVNGKVYIGKTKRSIANRWREHGKDADRGSMQKLHQAIRKYGKDSFTIEVLFQLDCLNHIHFLERKYIIKFKTTNFKFGYNGTNGGDGGFVSDESRKKMSLAHKGVKLSKQHRDSISLSLKGRVVSEETRNKIRISNTGRVQSEFTKRKLRIAKLGTHLSEETKRKISISNKKHPSNKKKGVPWTKQEHLIHKLANLKRKEKLCV